MFEASLKETLKSIFGVKKVTFDQISDTQEQECLFIEIQESFNTFKDKRAIAKVTGSAVLFGNNEKLPFGFFSKKIIQADAQLTKDIYFFDIESNVKTYGNIVQRGFSFVYFFNSQYDPAVGIINEIDLEIEES